MYTTNKERMEEKIKAFSEFGDLGNGGITRLEGSPENLAARAEFKRRAEALGLVFETDDVANMYATLPGSEPGLKKIVIGSHMDSVRSGGNYDGIYGVLAGLEAIETIVTEKIPHRHPITVMSWTNEEGSRFEPSMMSSGIVCGKFEKEKMLAVVERSVDKVGTVTFGESITESGFQGDEKNRLGPDGCICYFEPHIEQGPVLEEEGLEIGVVEGVVGMIKYDIILEGESAHAGCTPQSYRKDALRAASKVILDLWDHLGGLDDKLVFTMGQIECRPNVHTIVPNYIKFSLDARHQDMGLLENIVGYIDNYPGDVYGCKMTAERHWGRDTVVFNDEMIGFVEDAVNGLGYTNKRMYSGAGHDAQYVADVLPAVMIFIPSVGGLSHTVVEYSTPDQLWHGANVLLGAVLEADAKL